MSIGFVYFIEEEERSRIKIGYSEKHPIQRLKSFQTGNSNKLNLMGYIEGTKEDEKNLHLEFSKERIRGEHEWFESSKILINKIISLLEVNKNIKNDEIKKISTNNIIYTVDDKEIIGDENLNRYGKEYNDDGELIYEGWFKDGFRNGQGIEIFTDGRNYKGEFQDGKRHGQGVVDFPNGDKYEGEWKDGKVWNVKVYNKDGKMIYTWKNGVGV